MISRVHLRRTVIGRRSLSWQTPFSRQGVLELWLNGKSENKSPLRKTISRSRSRASESTCGKRPKKKDA